MSTILILCTGNSCRSQMAEYFLKSIDPALDVHSAGTHPAAAVHPKAAEVMCEAGIPLDSAFPKSVDRFLHRPFDYVITVCDHARETCPVFTGTVLHRLHIGFDDPAEAVGTEEEIHSVFRRIRDEIRGGMERFYRETIGSSARSRQEGTR